MTKQVPKRPSHLSRYGEICLRALTDAGLGEKISLPEKWREAHNLREWFREVFLNAAEE